MFKNLRIGTKLIIVFAVILAGLLGVGAYGVLSLQDIAAQNAALYHENVLSISAAAELYKEFYTFRTTASETVSMNFTPDGAARLRDALDQADKNIDAIYKKYESLFSAKGNESFGTLRSSFSTYLTAMQSLDNDIRRGDWEKAKKTLQSSAERATSIGYDLGEISNRNIDLAKTKAAGNAGASTTATYIMIGAAGIASILSALFAIFVTRGITKPVRKLMNASNKLAAGNTDISLGIKTKDEIGQLAAAFGRMVNAIRAVISDAKMLSEQAVAGHLSMRADASRHQGAFREMIEGINNTLDGFVSPFEEFQNALGRMCINDFTTGVEGDYQGDLKDMGDAINKVKDQMNSITDSFILLSRGDFSELPAIEELGRRSENDHLIPSAIQMMRAINAAINEANALSNAVICGDLSVRSDESQYQGRYRELIEGINHIMDAMATPMYEAIDALGTMAQNDYTVRVSDEYQGAFADLSDSVNKVISTLNKVMHEINNAASQVASGAHQVSAGSQALSQGSTEQAMAIEQLTATISQIAAQTKENAESADEASRVASGVKESACEGNAYMQDMLHSMEEINDASASISRIIKVIDDIAFQTNILALNAAVEAARAGVHGKGFAVVAEEVRNLAAKSAEAARDTTTLIEGSIQKTETGTKTAAEAAGALERITKDLEKAAELMGRIALSSNEQASGISQVNRGVEQVAQVVQSNSATAQQSAATTQELSSQAEMLRGMVGRFRLKDAELER